MQKQYRLQFRCQILLKYNDEIKNRDESFFLRELQSIDSELFKEINLSEFLNDIIDQYAAPRGLNNRIIKNIEQDVYLNGDVFALESIFINLLSNAEKYSDENITIVLKSDNEHIKVNVIDTGIGISNKDKERLFAKFFRVGDEQTRKSKGTGLGLFIVNNLLKLHDATIEVKNNQQKGTNFEVTFNVLVT